MIPAKFTCCFLLLVLHYCAAAQQKRVSIRIGQEQSTLLEGYETQIVLQKKQFKIQVMLENVAGVYVFASFSDSICFRLTEQDTIAGFIDMHDRVMKESDYNREKELFVTDDNNCGYWNYDKEKSWQGFNRKVVRIDETKLVAVKTVKSIYYVPAQKEIKLKDIHKPIYLFFVAIGGLDANGKPTAELMRRKVKISWREED